MFSPISESDIVRSEKRFVDYKKILLLLVVFSLISGCASTRIASPDQLLAYKATIAGKSDDARNLLKQSENDSFSKFILSCIELSEGNLTLARQYASEFMENEPNIPEGKVLVELIEKRKTSPSEPWTSSFSSAWKASGSPELTVIDNFFEGAFINETESCENRKLPEAIVGTPNELLAAIELGLGCDNKKFIELCLSHTSPETPMAIKLLALAWLDIELNTSRCNGSELPKDLLKHAQERRHELVQQLSLEMPLDITFAVMAILDQTSEQATFSLADIEKIEKAIYRPRLAPLPEELYSEYLRRFIALESLNPYLSAAGMVLTVDNSIISFLALRRKAIATAENASPEIRGRLAVILEKAARAQIKHRTMTELLGSISLLHSSAELRNDTISKERDKAVLDFSHKLFQPLYVVFSCIFWPIRPLMIDSLDLQMKDEIGFYLLFSDAEVPAEYVNLMNNSQ